jgi:hypothetical protein
LKYLLTILFILLFYIGYSQINVVFLSDGYLQSDSITFVTHVEEIIDEFSNTAPYDTAIEDSLFKFHLIFTVSNERGAGRLYVDTVDNYYGSTFGLDSLYRLLGVNNFDSILSVLNTNVPDWDYPIVIVNDSTYGGSGSFPEDSIPISFASLGWLETDTTPANQSYPTPYLADLVIHEFGHSFGGLADEYTDSEVGCPQSEDTIRYDRPNVTNDTVNDRKWYFLTDSSLGYFEGANYCDEWFRPTSEYNNIFTAIISSCKMGPDITKGYCPVCSYHIEQRIDEEMNNSVLPIKLVWIDASIINHAVQINWETASEIRVDRFEVFHSTNGFSWNFIGSQAPKGPSAYTHIHESPVNGINYYRFIEIDLDGNKNESPVVYVNYKTKQEVNYWNGQSFIINLNDPFILNIYTNTGQLLFSYKNKKEILFDISGMFYYTLISKELIEQGKIIKK